jgi:hypothetical protein
MFAWLLGLWDRMNRSTDMASLSQARSDRVAPEDRRGIGSFGDRVIPGK